MGFFNYALNIKVNIWSDLKHFKFTPFIGKIPARAYFEVDYKSRSDKKASSVKKLSQANLTSLEERLKSSEIVMNDLAREIEFARRQEDLLRETGGFEYQL